MPIREWGLGLEDLTEYYHRYGLYFTDFGLNKISQNWFFTRGVVDQTFQWATHPKTKRDFSLRSPVEIDLVGFRVSNDCQIEEVRLIQCKEHCTAKMVPRIARSMLMPKLSGIIWEAQKRKIFSKYLSFVTIEPKAKKMLKDNEIKLLSFKTMIKQLLRLTLIFERIKRKGFSREPLFWMLQSLLKDEFIDEKLIQKIQGSLEK